MSGEPEEAQKLSTMGNQRGADQHPDPVSTVLPIPPARSGERPQAFGGFKENDVPNLGCTSIEPATIGRYLHIVGQIISGEDITIDGHVEGTVQVPRNCVTVGINGRVTAAVIAREIVVYGVIRGNVSALDKIDLREGANLVGDIKTARIVIEDGAYFKGAVDITGHGEGKTGGMIQTPSVSERAYLEARYAQLVEQKYIHQISRVEEAEMEKLNAQLSHAEADFYEPILQRLRSSQSAVQQSSMSTETTR